VMTQRAGCLCKLCTVQFFSTQSTILYAGVRIEQTRYTPANMQVGMAAYCSAGFEGCCASCVTASATASCTLQPCDAPVPCFFFTSVTQNGWRVCADGRGHGVACLFSNPQLLQLTAAASCGSTYCVNNKACITMALQCFGSL
jgi:hypothetical protein